VFLRKKNPGLPVHPVDRDRGWTGTGTSPVRTDRSGPGLQPYLAEQQRPEASGQQAFWQQQEAVSLKYTQVNMGGSRRVGLSGSPAGAACYLQAELLLAHKIGNLAE
jgi:hypothetical protein